MLLFQNLKGPYLWSQCLFLSRGPLSPASTRPLPIGTFMERISKLIQSFWPQAHPCSFLAHLCHAGSSCLCPPHPSVRAQPKMLLSAGCSCLPWPIKCISYSQCTKTQFLKLQCNYQMIGQADLKQFLEMWPKCWSHKRLKKELNFIYLISAKCFTNFYWFLKKERWEESVLTPTGYQMNKQSEVYYFQISHLLSRCPIGFQFHCSNTCWADPGLTIQAGCLGGKMRGSIPGLEWVGGPGEGTWRLWRGTEYLGTSLEFQVIDPALSLLFVGCWASYLLLRASGLKNAHFM